MIPLHPQFEIYLRGEAGPLILIFLARDQGSEERVQDVGRREGDGFPERRFAVLPDMLSFVFPLRFGVSTEFSSMYGFSVILN
jgi:hypothetical protein